MVAETKAAKNLEFEKAALLRDRIIELRKDEELLSPLTRFKYLLTYRKGNAIILLLHRPSEGLTVPRLITL